MDGIFVIDKPQGMTSHDVVARVRRIIRNPESATRDRVGHAGTLDPMATGVLPVVVGAATRLVEYLAEADKAYRAVVILGATSDTYDAEGTITPTPDAVMPDLSTIEKALSEFRGTIEQVPPMHSALKVGGKKLYDLARQGIEVERKARRVTISKLDIEAYTPPTLQLFVECSKGTYIRSLAYDLGVALGTGAYLGGLVRTRVGAFTLDDAITLEGMESAFGAGTWHESLRPPESILAGWPVYNVDEAGEQDVLHGKALPLPAGKADNNRLAALRGTNGSLLAIAEWDEASEMWHPKKVFAAGR
ncbi:MAG TPA: tRNA pseudouridine(55) synthase TruB [Chloroflexia bacterium]|nr:tRNA pseudouridine(55) synthase TruB [Chloroflexia bacterium]